MSNPIKQHYVPQVYLKFFAQKRRKVWEIIVADKKNKKPYLANVRDVAFEKNFYTVEKLGEQKYVYEKFFAEHVEPLISKSFNQLISLCTSVFSKDRDNVINKRLRSALSLIVITQLLRTPKSRAYQYDISKRIFPTALENIIEKLNPYIFPDQKERLQTLNLDDMFKELDMSFITDIDRIKRFAEIIYNKHWIIYRNDDYKKTPFMTSDHPVVQFNMEGFSTSLEDNGIGNKNSVIHYPINPQLILAMYDKRNFFFQSMNDLDGQLVFLDIKKDISYINKANQMQYEQCTQHAFFKPFI